MHATSTCGATANSNHRPLLNPSSTGCSGSLRSRGNLPASSGSSCPIRSSGPTSPTARVPSSIALPCAGRLPAAQHPIIDGVGRRTRQEPRSQLAEAGLRGRSTAPPSHLRTLRLHASQRSPGGAVLRLAVRTSNGFRRARPGTRTGLLTTDPTVAPHLPSNLPVTATLAGRMVIDLTSDTAISNGRDSLAEQALVASARTGDADAFGQLVQLHERVVVRTALAALGRADDAEDVAQDAFVLAWRKLPTFRGDSSFRTWLLTIVWHEALGRRKARARWWQRFVSPRGDNRATRCSSSER